VKENEKQAAPVLAVHAKATNWCETHQIEKLSLSFRRFENKVGREKKTPSLQ